MLIHLLITTNSLDLKNTFNQSIVPILPQTFMLRYTLKLIFILYFYVYKDNNKFKYFLRMENYSHRRLYIFYFSPDREYNQFNILLKIQTMNLH